MLTNFTWIQIAYIKGMHSPDLIYVRQRHLFAEQTYHMVNLTFAKTAKPANIQNQQILWKIQLAKYIKYIWHQISWCFLCNFVRAWVINIFLQDASTYGCLKMLFAFLFRFPIYARKSFHKRPNNHSFVCGVVSNMYVMNHIALVVWQCPPVFCVAKYAIKRGRVKLIGGQ